MTGDTNPLRGLAFYQLTQEDLGAVMVLQQLVLSGLPDPSWYVACTVQEHETNLSHGDVVACREGKLLTGFAVLSKWDTRGENAYAAKLGQQVENSFDVRDVMVHPDYRRRGIHSEFLRLFMETARALDGEVLYATIDPENFPSVKSFEKAGFQHVKTQPAYDGRLRAYYRKEI